MKVTVKRGELSDAIKMVKPYAKKSPRPILECVRIDASDAGLVFEATDMSNAIRADIDCSPDSLGVGHVDAARLAAIVAECTSEEITLLQTGDNNIQIICGEAGTFRLRLFTGDEFPRLPVPTEDAPGWTLESGVFCNLVERSAFAHGEHGKTATHAVSVKQVDGRLEFVATDGKRLARMRGPYIESHDGEIEAYVLVSPSTLLAAQRLVGEHGSTPIRISVSNEVIFFAGPGVLLTSRLVNGTFVRYENAIPPAGKKVATMVVGEWERAIRRASLFLDAVEQFGVQVVFDKGEVSVVPRSQENGTFTGKLPAEWKHKRTVVMFNGRFVLDVLRRMDPSAEIRVSIDTAKSPVRMTDSAAFTYVIAPMANV